VGLPVDHDPTTSAYAFAAIVVVGDRFFAHSDEALVENVEHLEERHFL
jgi:hypothetical protein